ncbi:hypothetical protein RchiOBHm_Chr1g0337571 [Rosa chinensis]|uniref:Uncharacterized protein n=1 Tax=Rosa chinensis TaxID=74649 RepID=A0A2P6SCZ9_ROSCH|nr:hypothetical protein RchiOBHm_Chr1g0337571 [Rosa chinensis]
MVCKICARNLVSFGATSVNGRSFQWVVVTILFNLHMRIVCQEFGRWVPLL